MEVETQILITLMLEPLTGPTIKQHIRKLFAQRAVVQDKQLYLLLTRLERIGAIEKGASSEYASQREYIYQITSRGVELFKHFLQECSAEMMKDDAEFLVRIAFFDLLSREIRLKLLYWKDSILAQKLAHIQELKLQAGANWRQSSAGQVLIFIEEQSSIQMNWLQAIIVDTQKEQKVDDNV